MKQYRKVKLKSGKWITLHMEDNVLSTFDYLEDRRASSPAHDGQYWGLVFNVLNAQKRRNQNIKNQQLSLF